jgi:hypothetical protein
VGALRLPGMAEVTDVSVAILLRCRAEFKMKGDSPEVVYFALFNPVLRIFSETCDPGLFLHRHVANIRCGRGRKRRRD